MFEAAADVAESEPLRTADGRMSKSEPIELAAMLAVGVTMTEEGLDKDEVHSPDPSVSWVEWEGELDASDELRGGTTMGGGRLVCEGAGPRRCSC